LRGGRRRGPGKRAPKDIFSPGAKKEQKKSVPAPPPRNQPISPPTMITPPKVAGSVEKIKVEKEVVKPKVKAPKPETDKVTEVKKEITTEEKIEESSKEIIAEQIFGASKTKKTRGLKQIKKKEVNNTKDLNVQSDRAAELIEQSRQRAMKPVIETLIVKKEVKPVVTKKRRNTKTSYQPAARAKRLNRSRHMEYKYEMRKLLDDINVPEEHRSNLLGTIWAKGERKTASDAKDFLVEKMTEGAINEEQKSRLEKVIDDYTIRR